MGPELGSHMISHVMNYGVEIQLGEVKRFQIEGNHKVVEISKWDHYLGEAITIAGGCSSEEFGATWRAGIFR